jgi:hypothetical protein
MQGIAEVQAGSGIVKHFEGGILHGFHMPAGREEGKDGKQANGDGKVIG